MQTPSQNQIKDSEGRFYLIRSETYNGRSTAQIEWIVAEKLADRMWRRVREFTRKSDAQEWLYICAKV
jgi:hypothetical protein